MYPTVYPPVFPPGYVPPSLLNPPQRTSVAPWPSDNPRGFPPSPTHGQARPPLSPSRSPNGTNQVPLPSSRSPNGTHQMALPPAASTRGLGPVPLPLTPPGSPNVQVQAPLTPPPPHTPSLLLSSASIQATDGSNHSQAPGLITSANGTKMAKWSPIPLHTPVIPSEDDPPAVQYPDGGQADPPQTELKQWNDGGVTITLVDTGGAVRFTRGEPQATDAPGPHTPPAQLDPSHSNPWAAQTYPATGMRPIPYSPIYSPVGPSYQNPWQTIHYHQASPCTCGRVHQTQGVYTQW